MVELVNTRPEQLIDTSVVDSQSGPHTRRVHWTLSRLRDHCMDYFTGAERVFTKHTCNIRFNVLLEIAP